MLALFAIVFLSSGDATAEGVALTFDDLPTLLLTNSIAYADRTTVELLGGLRHACPLCEHSDEVQPPVPQPATTNTSSRYFIKSKGAKNFLAPLSNAILKLVL